MEVSLENELENTIERFRTAVNALNSTTVRECPATVLSALLARDSIAADLKRSDCLPVQALELVELDTKLRAVAAECSEALGPGRLEEWRDSLRPPIEAWWWRLDEQSAEADARRRPWLPLLTGILLTLSASLTADIARRFLSNGPDFYGALTTISQGALTLIAGSSLTQTGRSRINRWLGSFGVRPENARQWYPGLAACLLLLVGLLHSSLPWIAIHYYDRQGRALFQRGEVSSAIEHFRRAAALAPARFEPHYNLGSALEEFLEVDKAIGEYQLSIQANPTFYPSYNNLARLYLIKQKDPENALRALRRGIDSWTKELEAKKFVCGTPPPSAECLAGYSLYKNRAWVNIEMKWFSLAAFDLKEAQRLNPNGAAASCLLGNLADAQGRASIAIENWSNCLERMRRTSELEEIWIGRAKERQLDASR